MNARLSVGQFQQEVKKDDASLVEILAALILGGIGIILALLGIYLDNAPLYIAGWVIIVLSIVNAVAKAGRSIIGLISDYQDFKNHLKSRKR